MKFEKLMNTSSDFHVRVASDDTRKLRRRSDEDEDDDNRWIPVKTCADVFT